MAIIQSGVSGSTLMTVDPTYTAGRVAIRPIEQLGTYAYGGRTGDVTGIGVGPIFSMRFVAGSAGSAQIAIIQRISINWIVKTTAFGTAGELAVGAYVARSFTASDSAQTPIVLTGNNNKNRTSAQTSQIAATGDMRIANASTITTGTRTLDANAFAVANSYYGTTLLTTGVQPLQQTILYETFPGDTPFILQSNEGIVIQNLVAFAASGVVVFAINIEWSESATSATTSY